MYDIYDITYVSVCCFQLLITGDVLDARISFRGCVLDTLLYYFVCLDALAMVADVEMVCLLYESLLYLFMFFLYV